VFINDDVKLSVLLKKKNVWEKEEMAKVADYKGI
jgi:hypothetical protein